MERKSDTWNGDTMRGPWGQSSRCSGADFGLEGIGGALPKLMSYEFFTSCTKDHKSNEVSIVPMPICAESMPCVSRLTVLAPRSLLQPWCPGTPGIHKSTEKATWNSERACMTWWTANQSKRLNANVCHTHPKANSCRSWQKLKCKHFQEWIIVRTHNHVSK